MLKKAEVNVLKGHVLAKSGSKVKAIAVKGKTCSITVEGGDVEAEGLDPPLNNPDKANKNDSQYAINITIKPGFPKSHVVAKGLVKVDANAGNIEAQSGSHIDAHNANVQTTGGVVLAYGGSKIRALDKGAVRAFKDSKVEAFDGSAVNAEYGSYVDAYSYSDVYTSPGAKVNARALSRITTASLDTVIKAEPGANIIEIK